ncbi:MAG: hypothetical protein AB1405_10440 [Bdellovibrionota bacterium]
MNGLRGKGGVLRGTAFAAVAAFCLSSPAAALDSKAPSNTDALPLVIRGQEVPSLLGENPLKLSAFTCKGESAVPLLFQVDEVNADGRVLPAEAAPRLLADEKPGVLDENDEIVLLLRDLQGECPSERLVQAQGKVTAVQVSAEYLKAPAWVYFLAGERGYVPSGGYVRYDAAKNLAATSAQSWGYLPQQPAITSLISYRDLRGREEEDLVDRLKVRFKIRALKSLVRLSIDEDDLEYALEGVRTGPVRVSREVTVTVKTVPGFTLHAFVRYEHYERLWRGHVRFRVPGLAALFLSSMDATFAHDFTDLRGLTLLTSGLPQGALIDGKMIEREKSILFGTEPWYFLSGGGLNQVTALDLDKGLDLRAGTLFIDDPAYEDPPEGTPGGVPTIGYQFLGWENLEARWYSFGANVATLRGFPEGGASGFYKTLHAPVTIKAGDGKK